MQTRNRLFIAASATALLASCATTADDRYATIKPGYDARMVNDARYIAAVESIAATRGVEVKWVNPPKVRDGDD